MLSDQGNKYKKKYIMDTLIIILPKKIFIERRQEKESTQEIHIEEKYWMYF
jgi:hypothetical protein